MRHRAWNDTTRRLALTLGILTTAAGRNGFAAPNGYSQIPIAKVFADGVAAFTISHAKLTDKTTVYTSQYGISNQFEVGMDYLAEPASQRTMVFNTKYLFVHRPGQLPDIAVGLQNVASHQYTQPYLVATSHPSEFGGSLGIIRNGKKYFPMAGVSYTPNPKLQVVVDTIRGHDGYSSAGVIYSLTDRLQANLAYAFPNAHANPHGYLFNLAYVFHLIQGKPQAPPGEEPQKPGTSGGGNSGNKSSPSAGSSQGGTAK